MMPHESMTAQRFRRQLLARIHTHAQSGIAAIEFAFLVPVLLVLLMGGVDMGQMLYAYYRLDQAVAAGAQYAQLNASKVSSANGAALASSIANVVANANGTSWANDTIVVNNGPSVTITNGTASNGGTAANADNCYCPSGSPPSWTWGSSVTCSSSCSGGSGIGGKYVTITSSVAYHPILKIYSFITDSTITQNAAVQAQ